MKEKNIIFRQYTEDDYIEVDKLNELEGWSNLVARRDETKEAWNNSNIAYVAVEGEKIVGCVRGMTDKQISLYICELLIAKEYRGLGIGQELLKYVHNLYPKTRMELLASSTSKSFYEKLNFRAFYGYRKTIEE